MCLDQKHCHRAGNVHRQARIARRRLYWFSTPPMRVAESIAKRSYPIHNIHRAAEDVFNWFLNALIGAKFNARAAIP
jgi:hypothetical protein